MPLRALFATRALPIFPPELLFRCHGVAFVVATGDLPGVVDLLRSWGRGPLVHLSSFLGVSQKKDPRAIEGTRALMERRTIFNVVKLVDWLIS